MRLEARSAFDHKGRHDVGAPEWPLAGIRAVGNEPPDIWLNGSGIDNDLLLAAVGQCVEKGPHVATVFASPTSLWDAMKAIADSGPTAKLDVPPILYCYMHEVCGVFGVEGVVGSC